jgi:hypothetical protein
MNMTETTYNWAEVGAKAQRITWSGENDGDTIQGIVANLKEVTRKDETTGTVLELDDQDTGDAYTVWPKSQLLRLITEAKIQPGDMIKIVYLGKQKLRTDKTKSFRAYKLFVAVQV